MANEKECFSEIPTKRARIEEDLGDSGHCPLNTLGASSSNGHDAEAPTDCTTPSIPSKNCEIHHFPDNLDQGGQGLSPLAEYSDATRSSSMQTEENKHAASNKDGAEEEREENVEQDESNDSWSTISDLSGMSEDAWKPISGPMAWVQRQISMGTDPRSILNEMIPSGMDIPDELDNYSMWRLIINLLLEPPKRKKLENINTLEDGVRLLKTCKNIMVLTGAGVSVSCGIPDFRSRNGIYSRLAVDFPNLPDPQAMFDINFFKSDPRPFFKFAKEIYPGQFEPSKCHKFISLLNEQGKLLQNYTQNIDTLEQVAGIKNVIQCHGSFATAQCMACEHKVESEVIREDIFNQVIPVCPVCPPDTPLAIMKPNIVFFGESLPEEFHRQMAADKDECDLLIVIGSSLKVRPVALIPNSLPAHVPQILINRERLRHIRFDVELLGDCDVIVNELCKRLGDGWNILCNEQPSLQQINKSELNKFSQGTCPNISTSYVDSCELRADTCLATSDSSNSSDSTSQSININQTTDNSSCETLVPSVSTHNSSEGNSQLCSEPLYVNVEESSNASLNNISSPDATTNHLKSVCQPHPQLSLAKRLKSDQFLFLPPNRYVFSGAEVYSDANDSDSDDDSDDDQYEDDTSLVCKNSDANSSNNCDQANCVADEVKMSNGDEKKENYEVNVSTSDMLDTGKTSLV